MAGAPIADLLDENPTFWGELHRRQPAGWGRSNLEALQRRLRALYFPGHLREQGYRLRGHVHSWSALGLLMVSVTSATSLAEERVHGSLDLLMTTPLSTLAILRKNGADHSAESEAEHLTRPCWCWARHSDWERAWRPFCSEH